MWQAHCDPLGHLLRGCTSTSPSSSVPPGAELHLPPQQAKGGSWVCHVPKDMWELSAFSTCLYLQKLS